MNVEQLLRALVQVRSDINRLSRLSLLHSDPGFFQNKRSILGRVIEIKNQISLIESFGKTASLQGKPHFESGDWVRIESDSGQTPLESSSKVLVRTVSGLETTQNGQAIFSENPNVKPTSSQEFGSPARQSFDTFSSTMSSDFGRSEVVRAVPESELKLVRIHQADETVSPERKIRLAVLDTKLPPFRLGEPIVVRVIESIGKRALVEVKGSRLIVELSSNLIPGMQIKTQIVSLKPEVVLESSSSEKSGIPLQDTGPASPRLLRGQSLFAEVMGKDGGEWILRIAGQKFSTRMSTSRVTLSNPNPQAPVVEKHSLHHGEIVRIRYQKSFPVKDSRSSKPFLTSARVVRKGAIVQLQLPKQPEKPGFFRNRLNQTEIRKMVSVVRKPFSSFQVKELVPVRVLAQLEEGRLDLQIEKKGFEQTIQVKAWETSTGKSTPPASSVRLKVISARPPSFTKGETVTLRIEETGPGETTVRVKGARVAVQASPGLQTGKEFSAKVIEAGHHPVLETIHKETDAAQKSLNSLHGLKTEGHQGLLTGHVIKNLGKNLFQLNTGLGILDVLAPRKLEIGQELIFQVEEVGTEVRLKVQDWGVSAEETARTLIEKQLPLIQQPEKVFQYLKLALEKAIAESAGLEKDPLIGKIHRFLQETGSSPPDSSQISRFVKDGGLHYEKKLFDLLPKDSIPDIEGDFKRLLLELSNLPAGAFSTQFGQVQNLADQYLKWLEVQQASNVLHTLSGESFRLEIPFSVGAESIMAQLSFGPDSRGDSDDPEKRQNGTSVLFLLDLEGFGKTRVDAFISGSQLAATVYIENEDALSLIQRELGSLYEAFKSDGFESIKVEAKVLKDLEETEFREPELLGPKAVRDRIRLLNIEA